MIIFLTLVALATIFVLYYIKKRKLNKKNEGRSNFPNENEPEDNNEEKEKR